MKAAIYCRLSDADRDKRSATDDSASIQNQKNMLIQYAMDRGWEIFRIYSDDNYSGADRSRPEFNQMIQDAQARKFNIVLCKSQSRFTRELELVETYIHTLFPALGIRFVSLVDNADSYSRGNKKARQISALVNEWYLEDLSDNIRSVLTGRREQGFHIGSFAPYGYLKDPNRKGHLIIDPEAASVVRNIFSLYLEGKGKRSIARILNNQKIPNPTEYKRLQGYVTNKAGANSGLWTYSAISHLLTNEVYAGHMIQGKSGTASYKIQETVTYPKEQWIIVRNTHEPIIPEDMWKKTQDLITKKAQKAGYSREDGIFARKVHCLSCGYRMRSVKYGNKRGLQCSRHTLSYNTCPGSYISLQKLERIVLAQLSLLTEELLDEDLLEEGIDLFPEINGRKTSPEKEFTQLADKKALISQYKDCRSLTKEMITVLIDYLQVGKQDPETKRTPVIIHWNF